VLLETADAVLLEPPPPPLRASVNNPLTVTVPPVQEDTLALNCENPATLQKYNPLEVAVVTNAPVVLAVDVQTDETQLEPSTVASNATVAVSLMTT
jgi:hypothetical protein